MQDPPRIGRKPLPPGHARKVKFDLRLRRSELEQWRGHARQRGVALSALIRAAVKSYVQGDVSENN